MTAADHLEWGQTAFPAVGACTRYTLTALTADGGTPTIAGSWTVALSQTPSDAGRYSSLSGCTNTVTSTTVMSGAQASVYLSPARPGPLTLNASNAQLGDAGFATDIRSGAPASLSFNMPTLAPVGDCVPGFVSARDQYGNLIHGRGQMLSLSSTTSGAEFYTSMDCSGVMSTSLSMPYPDDNVVAFSFRSNAGGDNRLIAILSTSGVSTSHTVRMRVLPMRLTLTPLSTTGYSDTCITAVSVNKVDAADSGELFDGGEVVQLSGSPEVIFRAANCAGPPITQITPSRFVSSVNLGISIPADAGIYALTATEPLLGMAMSSVTITGTRPTGLQFVDVPDAGVRGICYPASVRYVDDAGRPTVVGAPSTMTFSGASIWVDGGCGGATGTTLTVPADASQADFVFRETTAASVTLRATSSYSALTTQKVVTMSNPPPVRIRFQNQPFSGTVGTCYTRAVELISAEGVVTVAPMSSPVTVYGTTTDGLYVGAAGSNCSSLGSSTNITIASGASSANFVMRKSTYGTTTITARSTTYGDAGTTVNMVNPCSDFGESCGPINPCCSSNPTLVCGSTNTCRCVISGCIPRGGFNCGSSSNCCSGIISGSTCQ